MKKSLIMMAGCAIALGAVCTSPATAKDYFHKTEIQIHMDFDRTKGFEDSNGDEISSEILTTTIAHFSEWKYGDNFFFFDIEGKDGYKPEPAQYYGEFATRISLDKIILGPENGSNMLGSFLKETYIKLEYNGGSPVNSVSQFDYIDDALLYGVSFDLNLGQPNFGFTNISFLVKDFKAIDERDNSDTNWQVTLVWGQPFSIGSLNFGFEGFFDVWEYNDEVVVLTEPQIRLKLDSFVGKDSWLSSSAIGMEFELSTRFFSSSNNDVEFNPTVFWVTKF